MNSHTNCTLLPKKETHQPNPSPFRWCCPGTAAQTTQGIGCSHQHGISNLLCCCHSITDRVATGAFGNLLTASFNHLGVQWKWQKFWHKLSIPLLATGRQPSTFLHGKNTDIDILPNGKYLWNHHRLRGSCTAAIYSYPGGSTVHLYSPTIP